MKKIPMLEKFAAQSLVESDGELIFSKEKFAELIVAECIGVVEESRIKPGSGVCPVAITTSNIKKHFGVEE
jgi:hypothetical protein